MSYFLDEKTIKQSFDKLNSIKYGSANELYSFLLLKASGFGKFDYIELSKEEVKKKKRHKRKQYIDKFFHDFVH